MLNDSQTGIYSESMSRTPISLAELASQAFTAFDAIDEQWPEHFAASFPLGQIVTFHASKERTKTNEIAHALGGSI
jgi:hypothetical protein